MTLKRVVNCIRRIENGSAFCVLILLALFPALEIIFRKFFKTGIPGSSEYIHHLVLWIAFVGGMITSRQNAHLSFSILKDILAGSIKRRTLRFIDLISATICWAFFWSALSLCFVGFAVDRQIGPIPLRWVVLIMPVGFAGMAIRFTANQKNRMITTVLSIAGFILGLIFSFSSIGNLLSYTIPGIPEQIVILIEDFSFTLSGYVFPLIILLIISAFLGVPIFIVLGGIAYFLFFQSGGALETISNESYTILTSHSIPAIPLFTVTGYILSAGKGGERLVQLFKAVFGWVPGGLVIMAVAACAFFTTFTGASGVTILALGGLLAYILKEGGYSQPFTHGLLTASGSIGLLFPPSLAIILYGVIAHVNIKKMFVGGLIPGLVMILMITLYGILFAKKTRIESIPFQLTDAITAFRISIWEIILPIIIISGFLSGLMTIVETGAVAILYTLMIALFVHKEIRLIDLPDIIVKCVPIIGGILIILGSSKALSYYIIDAEIPMNLSEWVKNSIQSKFVFLILLNIALLITGCLMDIFSAIIVVVPLILPLGELFHIDPVHLGIIFLVNMELGYLTPPVGLNLFLASYRFEKPLGQIYRDVLPFLIVLLITVLMITYIPILSTGLVNVINL